MESIAKLDGTALLKEGLTAAATGKRDLARRLFTRVAHENPSDELAWICLAEISETLSGRIDNLRTAITKQPANTRAHAMLTAARKQLAARLLEIASNQSDRSSALPALLAAIDLDPANEVAAAKLVETSTEVVSFDESSQTSPSNIVIDERDGEVPENSLPQAKDLEAFFAPSPVPSASRTDTRHSFILRDTLADRGHCAFCMEPFKEEDGRCVLCGGTTTIRDPRLDDTTTRVDPGLMLAAVNRLTLVVKRSPQDARAHYELGMAYLNLNRTDAAVRWLKKSQELMPDTRVEAGLKTLASPPAKRNTAAPASVSPSMGAGNGTIPLRSDPGPAIPDKINEQEPTGKVVLVVDDSATVRRMIAMILERKGYRVVTAVDGEDGLEKMRENPVDLVLLDVMMPKLDGYLVCKTIRAIQKTLPIVMLSSKEGFFDRVRGKVAGSTAYMTKPFEPYELLKIVAQYCPTERNGAGS